MVENLNDLLQENDVHFLNVLGKDLLQEKVVHFLDRPGKPPDLNIIKKVWAMLLVQERGHRLLVTNPW